MRLLLFIAALCAALPACPAFALPTLSLDGTYESERERATHLLARGFSTGLALGLGPYFSIGGHYSRLQTEPFKDPTTAASGRQQYETVSGELGAGFSPTDSTDLSMTAGYIRSTTTGLGGFSSDPKDVVTGPTGSLTLTQRLAPHFEVFLGPAYSYLGHQRGWDGTAGLGLELARGLWLNGSYWGGQTRDGWTVGLHMDFAD